MKNTIESTLKVGDKVKINKPNCKVNGKIGHVFLLSRNGKGFEITGGEKMFNGYLEMFVYRPSSSPYPYFKRSELIKL